MKNVTRVSASLFSALALAGGFLAPVAEAKTNYRNQIIGGRAATMGGAYTAIADDGSAVFHNPAGLHYVQGTSLSGSASLYAVNSRNYERTVGTADWERKSENIVPGYFGLAKKLERWSFGFGYALQDVTKENQNQVFESVDAGAGQMDYYSLVMNTEDNHYLFGAGAAFEASSNLTLGLTLSYSYRHYLRHQNQYARYTNTDTENAFDHREIKSKGLKPMLGMMWSPVERWSVGFTLAKEIIFSQITEDVRNRQDKGSATPVFVRQTDLSKDRTPIESRLGVAFFSTPECLFSADFDYFHETNPGKNSVWNVALGAEYFFSPKLALRGGLFTNRSNVKEMVSTSRNLDERINVYGVTAGTGFYTPTNELTLGLVYARGRGEVQPFTSSTSKREFDYTDLKFVLASGYNF